MIHFSLKHAICVMCTTICMVVFANYDSIPIGYHSVGIDTYGDGITPVLDGECYALVWVSDGHEFKGFRYDGTLVDPENNKIVDDDGMLYICPIAKDGKCPPVSFMVKSAFRKSNQNGKYEVVILDTRISDSSLCGLRDSNMPVRINGWGFAKVLETQHKSVLTSAAKTMKLGNIVCVESELPKETRIPTITGFKLSENGDAIIEFNNTMECFSYFVKYGDDIAEIGKFSGKTLIVGAADPVQSFAVSIPHSELPENSAFFKISAKTDWTGEND